MDIYNLIVIGGGAAGFMTAITAAEIGLKKIKIFEASPHLLEKVRISGGGRCNLTNATWIPSDLIENYPRGGLRLMDAFSRFSTGDLYSWFEERGLKLKIESDNRVFPVSNSSLDVMDCLKELAYKYDIEIKIRNQVKTICKDSSDSFKILTRKGESYLSRKLLIATGGNPSGHKLAKSLGHEIIPPVPSLFTFANSDNQLKDCSGVSIKNIDLKILVNKNSFQNNGDLLITHWGFSGPGVLKLSSIAARELFLNKYNFKLIIKWSKYDEKDLFKIINNLRQSNGKSNLIYVRPLSYITRRLWIFLLNKMEIDKNKKWSEILSSERHKMINLLLCDEYAISGKGPFGEEFVSAGGVSTNEVNFKTMESLKCKGLYFSGEVLNIDGITGGFNFQHCWTSGWLAGKAIAKISSESNKTLS